MIFRTIDGNLVNITKYNFTNDKLYYLYIKNLKMPFTKLKEALDDKAK